MIKQFVKGKVAVFIDAANIFYSQRTLGWRVDYTKLKAYFMRETELMAIYLYTGKVGTNESQERFIAKITQLGYIVRAKEVKRIKVATDTFEWKGNLDAELIIDTLKTIHTYDTYILMSGDSDFAPLLDELKSQGKWVIVMSSKHHISRELIERAKYINLRKLKDEISYIKKSPPTLRSGERYDRNDTT
jgi:uncharacterized LabA/DUF88 family protein